MLAASDVPSDAAAGWRADLRLRIEAREGRTVIAEREHTGPLVVQKALHPEANGCCHVVVLHPPGGIAGGDQLTLSAAVGEDARALITTPAATKFYRSDAKPALQRQHFHVTGTLEWLPQETIVFAGAHAELETVIRLSPNASFLGWEMVVLGRPDAGERFHSGSMGQRFEIWRGDSPLWIERGSYKAETSALSAPWGLRGFPVFGTFAMVGALSADVIAAIRNIPDALGADCAFAITQRRGVILARYMGHQAEEGRACFTQTWEMVRPILLGAQAVRPRIWAT